MWRPGRSRYCPAILAVLVGVSCRSEPVGLGREFPDDTQAVAGIGADGLLHLSGPEVSRAVAKADFKEDMRFLLVGRRREKTIQTGGIAKTVTGCGFTLSRPSGGVPITVERLVEYDSETCQWVVAVGRYENKIAPPAADGYVIEGAQEILFEDIVGIDVARSTIVVDADTWNNQLGYFDGDHVHWTNNGNPTHWYLSGSHQILNSEQASLGFYGVEETFENHDFPGSWCDFDPEPSTWAEVAQNLIEVWPYFGDVHFHSSVNLWGQCSNLLHAEITTFFTSWGVGNIQASNGFAPQYESAD